MKPNFETMTRQELKAYVLTHRDDKEALDLLISRRSPDSEAVWYDASTSPEQTKEILQKKIQYDQRAFMNKNIKTGKDSVVIGNNINGEIGEGSVVIGATDSQGNTIINQPMAVGRGAKAGPNSIAIGAYASAGSNILHLIDQLKSMPEIQGNEEIRLKVDEFCLELQKSNPQQENIYSLWESLWSILNRTATLSGAISLGQQIGQALQTLPF
jgi:hypothetical protein